MTLVLIRFNKMYARGVWISINSSKKKSFVRDKTHKIIKYIIIPKETGSTKHVNDR